MLVGTPEGEEMSKPLSYQELRSEVLSDFETSLRYLQHALKGNDLAHFMSAFARVVEAQGGAGKFAVKTRLSRQSIYNAINHKSLRADSLFDIIRGLGLRFDLVPLDVPMKALATKYNRRATKRTKQGHRTRPALAAA
jgi:DNA-binding phage protein